MNTIDLRTSDSYDAKLDIMEECAKNRDTIKLFTLLELNGEWTKDHLAIARRMIKMVPFDDYVKNQDLINIIYIFFIQHPDITEHEEMVTYFIKKLSHHFKKKHTRHVFFYLNLIQRCVDTTNPYLPLSDNKLNGVGHLITKYRNECGSVCPLYINTKEKPSAYLMNKEIDAIISLTNFVVRTALKKIEFNVTVNYDESLNGSITRRFSEDDFTLFCALCKSVTFPFNRLNLTGHYLTEEAIDTLVNALNTNPRIKSLKLKNCYIQPGTAQRLARGLKKNRSLTSLCIADNPLDGASVEALLACVQKSAIDELDIRFTPVSDRSINALCSFQASMKKPAKVYISSEDYTNEEYAILNAPPFPWTCLYPREGTKSTYIGDHRLAKGALVASFTDMHTLKTISIDDRILNIFNAHMRMDLQHHTKQFYYKIDNKDNQTIIEIFNDLVLRENCYFLIDAYLIMAVGYTKKANGEMEYYCMQLSIRGSNLNPGEYRVSFGTDDPTSTVITIETIEDDSLEGHIAADGFA